MTPYTLFYKGYNTTINYDPETRLYYGTFLHTKGYSFFAEREKSQAEKSFREAVERHIARKNGYTYVRCDHYTPEEFLELFKSKQIREYCEKYIAENKKDWYDTDDEIAVKTLYDNSRVNGLHNIFHRSTTKRYPREHDN